MDAYEKEKQEDINLQFSALSLFCDRNIHKNNRDVYYEELDRRLRYVNLDLDKSFEYHKLIKDNEFITKHVEKTEKFRKPYIRALQVRLNDKNNNNFEITNKEIKEFITESEKKLYLKAENERN